MKKELGFLKAAAGHFSAINILGCYTFDGGFVYAGNGAIQAGIPYASATSLNIPTDELEAALGRMPDGVVLEPRATEAGVLAVLRGGRLRATIQCIDGEPPQRPDIDGDWERVPGGFARALELALPFTDKDGTWTTGISINDNLVRAVNNRCGIEITLEDGGLPKLLLTQDCARFVAENNPDSYLASDNSIVFRWDDRRWMRAQFLAYEFPASVDSIFAKADADASVPLTEDWRAAYADIAALADTVELQPDRMVGRRAASVVEAAAKTDVPAGHVSLWKTSVLGLVAPIATHWNPTAYPAPCMFRGPGFRGLLLGVK